ncbi:MAG: nitroreductase family protein [Deltaproteobacteria bacterium]|nr:nitroreductase family protein [Deltaproteobacteria bacterium]
MKKLIILIVTGLFILVNAGLVSAADDIIKLPDPQKEGGIPLMKALSLRQSTRGGFGPAVKLTMQQMSNMLWAADGINRPGTNHRTAPSAVDWQNIDIYVTTDDGLFLYDAQAHALKVLGKEDIRAVAGQHDFVAGAPVNLIYVADFAKAKGFGPDAKVMPTAETWSFVGTGAIAQNVYLWCASEGLACIVRAMADAEAIKKALNLRPEQHFMLAQTIAQFKK